MNNDARITSARAFLRSFNILLKSVRLYGFDHERTAAQFETAWKELRGGLSSEGEAGLLLGVSDSQLWLDGIPLKANPVERNLAELLGAANVARIQFSSRVTRDDFSRFVRAFATRGTRPAALAAHLKAALEETGEATIRISEVRFVAEDAALAGSSVAAELTARALGTDAGPMQTWLNHPQKLLQLIAAAEGAHSEPAAPSEGTPAGDSKALSPQEDELSGLMRLLTQLGQASRPPGRSPAVGEFQQQLAQLPATAQATLRQTLASLTGAARPSQPDKPLLLQLAEQLAIRFAVDRYQRGEVGIKGVHELLDRTSRSIETLRKVLGAHEEKMIRAGLAVESNTDILDRQFWASLPESGKHSVLLSPDVWCVPSRNIRQYVEQLLARPDPDAASAILLNYATSIHASDPEARGKAAVGLSDLVELYARADVRLLEAATRHVGEQLSSESVLDLQNQLSATFVRLSQEAAARHHYSVVQQSLATLENVKHGQPSLAERLRPRIGVENRVGEFIEEALRAPRLPENLANVLQCLPRVAAEQLAARFKRCVRCDERDRLVHLARELGPEGINSLRETLQTCPAAEAAGTVGLLSRLDVAALEELLPLRLRNWNRFSHDLVVRELACAGAPERGRLLLTLLDILDESVAPQALDEIGMTGDPTTALRLMRLAGGKLPQSASPYLRLKAVEALGRLRHPVAAPLLRQLVEAKQVWRWLHPRELRVAAAQALQKIDPEWAQSFLPGSRLNPAELALAPLDPDPRTPWVRQRRYRRILLPHTLTGVASTLRRDYNLSVKTLSLGGGLAASEGRPALGSQAELRLHSGLHHLCSQVVVREAPPQQMSFEIFEIDLPGRTRLRRLLAGFHLPTG
ncbi:MAG: HEAT repeat domain-containing protein [Terriglobia bacterium]